MVAFEALKLERRGEKKMGCGGRLKPLVEFDT